MVATPSIKYSLNPEHNKKNSDLNLTLMHLQKTVFTVDTKKKTATKILIKLESFSEQNSMIKCKYVEQCCLNSERAKVFS